MRSGACVIGSMWPAPATVTVDARGAARASPSATNSAAAGLVVPVTTSVGTVSFRNAAKREPLCENRFEVSSDLIRFEGQHLLALRRKLRPGASTIPVVDEARNREHAVLIGTRRREGSRYTNDLSSRVTRLRTEVAKNPEPGWLH